MTKERSTTDMIEAVDGKITYHTMRLAEFKTRIEERPVYAFEWCETALQSSVAIQEYAELSHWLQHVEAQSNTTDRDLLMEEIVKRYERDAHNAATRIPSSSSQMSNMVDNHKRAILASILGWLQNRFMGSLI